MRRTHFEAFQPICPACRLAGQPDSPLVLGVVIREAGDDVEEGILHCSNTDCFLEYPIIDGTPIIVPNTRAYIADHLPHLLMRRDLSPAIEGLIGDSVGAGSLFDVTRQHLSTYAWDAYAEFDTQETTDAACRPGAVARCLAAGLDLAGSAAPDANSLALDIGCSVGRSTLELASRTDGLVLGIDLSVTMTRMARQIMGTGSAHYPRRRIGVVFDRRTVAHDFPGRERVDFWIADAMCPPFRDHSIDLAVALNVLDCVPHPRDMLARLGQALRPGGRAVLSTPYDWSTGATPFEVWIGGHSQRAPSAGAAEPFLRTLLTAGAHPMSVEGLRIIGENLDFPWQTRLHDRSSVSYRVHLLALAAIAAARN